MGTARKLGWKRIQTLFDADHAGRSRRTEMVRDEFGDDFASFLLGGRNPPVLREDMLIVLLALKSKDGGSGLFRNSLLLPLFWKEGRHSPLLPRGLLELADSICADRELAGLSRDGRRGDGGWGLHPCFAVDIADWEDATETWKSAWGILAAGLHLKREGLRLRPGVFVSAAWDGRTLREVDSAVEKSRAAKQAGGSCLFLSAFESGELQHLANDGFQIKYLPFNTGLEASLAELLYYLEIPPKLLEPGDPECVRRCREYAVRLAGIRRPGLQKASDEYNFENVAPARAAELRRESGLDRTDALVVLASQVSAALLSIRAFSPSRVLLLVTPREKDDMEKHFHLPPRAISSGLPPEKIEIRTVDVGDPATVGGAVTDWLGENPWKAVVDVTGLTKAASSAAALAAAGAGAAVVAMQTDNPERAGGHVPGGERIVWIKR